VSVLLGSRAVQEESTVVVVPEGFVDGWENECPFCGYLGLGVGPYGAGRGFFCFGCGTRGTVEDDVEAGLS
jgi:hypothetical protein